MNFRDGRMKPAADGSAVARTYERIANELLQLRNDAKAMGDEQLRIALEHAYFETVAMRLVPGRSSGGSPRPLADPL